jgi:hypothetical protein
MRASAGIRLSGWWDARDWSSNEGGLEAEQPRQPQPPAAPRRESAACVLRLHRRAAFRAQSSRPLELSLVSTSAAPPQPRPPMPLRRNSAEDYLARGTNTTPAAHVLRKPHGLLCRIAPPSPTPRSGVMSRDNGPRRASTGRGPTGSARDVTWSWPGHDSDTEEVLLDFSLHGRRTGD